VGDDLPVREAPLDLVNVTDLAAAVRERRRTAQSIADEAVAAAGAQRLNAFTTVDAEGAAAAAAAVDAAVAAGLDPGPLAGVPVAVKDLIDHKGRVTTCGSSFLRDPASRTATVVSRLERAGAVIVGRTGLHEFAYGFSSENEWWGPVRNPWNPNTSPGGSSGGSAAAVAAGIVPLAIGTDTGGSVRVPAALCGCCGLKVTHGRVPLTGVFPLAPSLDTVGPIGTSVADLAIAYVVIAGDDPVDPWSVPRPVAAPGRPADLSELSIGVPVPWTERPVEPGVAAGFATALQRLEALGARVTPLDAPFLDPDRLPRASYAEVGAVHRAWFTEDPRRYGPSVAARLAIDLAHTADAIAAALEWRAGLRHAVARLFESVDVLLTPTTAATRKPIGEDTIEVGGRVESHRTALSWFTTLVNQAGVPALALPMAAPGQPPPSLQVIGPAWSEARLLEIGMALEEAGVTTGAPRASNRF
jgi:Asp-tRNA(Asn)/Glu-tRNA(Gln) amidotransferase A subunit family amidase